MIPTLIHVGGTSHRDALGKPNLKTWLHGLAAAADRPPLFVAVELDERTFRELKSQRAQLRCDLSTWRTIPSAVLDALADSLAYEPDAVLDVFPRVEILWLDKGTEKSGRHRMWFAEYQCLSVAKDIDFFTRDPDPLTVLSEATWEHFAKLGTLPAEARDEDLARVILDRLGREEQAGESTSERWAVVVVGANHARNEPGTMRWRLVEAGVTCRAVSIETHGPVGI